MRYSKLFGKTVRDDPRDETSVNAKLLIRAGFVRKEVAGVYNFLPLGLAVLNKIANIVREEMDKVGGQELFLSSLQNKLNWQKTDRWESFDALFKVKGRYEVEYVLGPTHEEVLVPLVKHFVNSYRDLPLYLYQIQTKFRDEPRAKSGILRGREFLMKDLYSFHTNEEDFNRYYQMMKKAYQKVFERCGLTALETLAGGGSFSEFSHEYQVLTPGGEDTIFYCPAFAKATAGKQNCHFSKNAEIMEKEKGKDCPDCGERLEEGKAIEVGNIFPLGTRFSQAFNLTYKNKKGVEKLVIMGCYGIGISRVMGAIVEVYHDQKGIIWPSSVAPYQAHLINLKTQNSKLKTTTQSLKLPPEMAYRKLEEAGIEVLYDDREDVTAGEKFADCDLIGIPVRLVVSDKTGDKVEWKKRDSEKTEIISLEEVIKRFA